MIEPPKNATARRSPGGAGHDQHPDRTSVRASAPVPAGALLVQLTVAQLGELLDAKLSCVSPAEPPREWFTIQQTADYLGCSRSMVNRLRDEGLPVAMLGDSPRVHRATLDRWLLARRSAAEAAE